MPTKINNTTGDRAQDEDWRRIYQLVTSLQSDLALLKAPSALTPVVPNTTPLPQPSAGTTVTPVEATGVVGILSTYSAEDHAHEGLHSIAAFGQTPLNGDATVQGGSGIFLAQTGQNIAINVSFGTTAPKVVLPAASPYTVGGGDITIWADTTLGPITIQLVGGAPNTGRFVFINNIGVGANAVTVTTTSGSVLNITSIAATGGVLYQSDGTNWRSLQNSVGN